MHTLLIGATGATGKHLAQQLLEAGHSLTLFVRSKERLSEYVKNHAQCTIIEGTVLDSDAATITEVVKGVDAVALCLGHNISVKGIWGAPHRLVRDTLRTLCAAVIKLGNEKKVKCVLMSSTGVQNRSVKEKRSLGERLVLTLVRLLVPPHPDNEQAAEYLRTYLGTQAPGVEWVAVRPDSLIDSDIVSEYTIHPAPTRSPIFNAGTTSRINVAHVMYSLLTDATLWNTWKGKMPVVYNREMTGE